MRSPTTSAEEFVLTLWTADPDLARAADAAGIDRIGVDLDRLGKEERQRGRGTWISDHREETLSELVPVLERAAPFARVDPLNDDSARQVDSVIERGAEVLMLPMVAVPEEAARFAELVAGRAEVVLLVERAGALERIAELAAVPGVDEIHLGLNDLAVSLCLPNRWLVLAEDHGVRAGEAVRAAGLPFGLGGVGRLGQNGLPIPADLVYAECARAGATGALISRSFLDGGRDLALEVARAREAVGRWRRSSPAQLEAAHARLARAAEASASW